MAWPKNVRKADLRIDYYRGSGKGGQHRNKRDTACRITHIPTGKSACSEERKSQVQNRKAAFRKLANSLIPPMKKALVEEVEPVRSDKRVRTYNFSNNTVKDVRVPDKKWNLKNILDGDLDELIEEVQKREE